MIVERQRRLIGIEDMSAKKQCSLSGQGSISISRKRSDIEGPNVIYDHKRRKDNLFSEDVLGEGETKAATEISIATGQPAGRLGHQVY